MSEYQKVVAYQPPTSATAPGMCADTAGRPFWNPIRRQCVDKHGHAGFSPPPPVPKQKFEVDGCELDNIKQSHSAARLCRPYKAYGVEMSPILGKSVLGPGVVPGEVGYKVCDPYWGISVRGRPGKGCASPVNGPIAWRKKHNGGHMFEALRCLNPYTTDVDDPLRAENAVVLPGSKPPPELNYIPRYRAGGDSSESDTHLIVVLSIVLFLLLGGIVLSYSKSN